MSEARHNWPKRWHAEWTDLSAVFRSDVQLTASEKNAQVGLNEAGVVITENDGRTVGIIVRSRDAAGGGGGSAILPADRPSDALIVYAGFPFLVMLDDKPKIRAIDLHPCSTIVSRGDFGLALRDHCGIAVIKHSDVSYFRVDHGEIYALASNERSGLIVKYTCNWGEKAELEIVLPQERHSGPPP